MFRVIGIEFNFRLGLIRIIFNFWYSQSYPCVTNALVYCAKVATAMVGRMEIVFNFQVGRFGIDVNFATHHLNPNTVFVLHISCILDANERGKVPLATAKKFLQP